MIIFQITDNGLLTFSDINKVPSYRIPNCSDVKGRTHNFSTVMTAYLALLVEFLTL